MAIVALFIASLALGVAIGAVILVVVVSRSLRTRLPVKKVTSGTWHHVVTELDGGKLRLYVDGKECEP